MKKDRMTSQEYQNMGKAQVLEDAIHTKIADYLTENLDGFFQTVENSNRHKGWYAAVQQNKLKARGSKTGFPDIVIWYHKHLAHTLCLEVKRPGEHARENQKAIHKLLEAQGCPTEVVHSVADVKEVFKKYNVPMRITDG